MIVALILSSYKKRTHVSSRRSMHRMDLEAEGKVPRSTIIKTLPWMQIKRVSLKKKKASSNKS